MLRDRPQQDQRQHAEQIFEERMAQIFQHLPMLTGFCVQDDLRVGELSLHTWPGADVSHAVAEELADSLEDLVSERPDAIERLRGRTFARSFQ